FCARSMASWGGGGIKFWEPVASVPPSFGPVAELRLQPNTEAAAAAARACLRNARRVTSMIASFIEQEQTKETKKESFSSLFPSLSSVQILITSSRSTPELEWVRGRP